MRYNKFVMIHFGNFNKQKAVGHLIGFGNSLDHEEILCAMGVISF